jgi:hypothetical protein
MKNALVYSLYQVVLHSTYYNISLSLQYYWALHHVRRLTPSLPLEGMIIFLLHFVTPSLSFLLAWQTACIAMRLCSLCRGDDGGNIVGLLSDRPGSDRVLRHRILLSSPHHNLHKYVAQHRHIHRGSRLFSCQLSTPSPIAQPPQYTIYLTLFKPCQPRQR